MSFDSLQYILFLPGAVLLSRAVPKRYRALLLLAASWLFYMGWNAVLLWLILSVTVVTYAAALVIERARRPLWKKLALAAAAAVTMGLLLYFKYFNFLGRTAAAVLGAFGGSGSWDPWEIVLPVGISFYTFQALSYTADVYRGRMTACRSFIHYALYIAFFPQLVAGPIERAERLLPQLEDPPTASKADLRAGCLLLLSGYFRKLVIADTLAPFADAVFAGAPEGMATVVGTALFAAQIYNDFAGYSEIALGSARLLGVRLMENFDRPYSALSIREFWQRWHISLTRWFTDYVYIPLGGSRRGIPRQVLATVTVFLLSGFWHGADWSFVIWGLLHGLYMTAGILWSAQGSKGAAEKNAGKETPLLRLLRRGAVLLAVGFAWIFFRAESMDAALGMVRALFSPWDLRAAYALLREPMLQWGGPWAFGCMLLLLLGSSRPLGALRDGIRAADEADRDMTPPGPVCFYLLGAILLAALIRTGAGGGSAFIYFQF